MKKLLLISILVYFAIPSIRAQRNGNMFDTLQFNRQVEFANWLVDYEYFTHLLTDSIKKLPENQDLKWYGYPVDNSWHAVGGNTIESTFRIAKHVILDSSFNVTDYSDQYDTSKLIAAGNALSRAENLFQLVHDTLGIYITSFVAFNPDQTISIWNLPAFQPSGQAIYGCEWEYIFDHTGLNLIKQNSYLSPVTAVWIGQPRELWLNYRTIDKPTIGSLFFVQSFSDYFTRVRIDTQISTSTIAKDSKGIYFWTHKMK